MLRFVILTVGYLVFSICQTATVYAGEDNKADPGITSMPAYREGKLPKGTYFYILDLDSTDGSDDDVVKGWIQIVREN